MEQAKEGRKKKKALVGKRSLEKGKEKTEKKVLFVALVLFT